MSAWWWLLVTETCSKLCIIEYIVVFWLNDILVKAISLVRQKHNNIIMIIDILLWQHVSVFP